MNLACFPINVIDERRRRVIKPHGMAVSSAHSESTSLQAASSRIPIHHVWREISEAFRVAVLGFDLQGMAMARLCAS
jgi:hypothetical protein